jgi:hypothetical protein
LKECLQKTKNFRELSEITPLSLKERVFTNYIPSNIGMQETALRFNYKFKVSTASLQLVGRVTCKLDFIGNLVPYTSPILRTQSIPRRRSDKKN